MLAPIDTPSGKRYCDTHLIETLREEDPTIRSKDFVSIIEELREKFPQEFSNINPEIRNSLRIFTKKMLDTIVEQYREEGEKVPTNYLSQNQILKKATGQTRKVLEKLLKEAVTLNKTQHPEWIIRRRKLQPYKQSTIKIRETFYAPELWMPVIKILGETHAQYTQVLTITANAKP